MNLAPTLIKSNESLRNPTYLEIAVILRWRSFPFTNTDKNIRLVLMSKERYQVHDVPYLLKVVEQK